MKERRKRRKEEGKKSEVDFLIEARLEEEHVCVSLCCAAGRRLSMPPAESVCTHRRSIGSRWEDGGMEGCRRKAPDN